MGPGAAALTGPSERTTLAQAERAAQLIQRKTRGVAQADLLFVLQVFSRERYTAKELAEVIPKETVMASSLWAEAVSKGRKEGRKEGLEKGLEKGLQTGAVQEARTFCTELTREHHPDIADRVMPLIMACDDIALLHEWGLQASRLSDAEFEELLRQEPAPAKPTKGGRRTPRPSRRAKGKRSR